MQMIVRVFDATIMGMGMVVLMRFVP